MTSSSYINLFSNMETLSAFNDFLPSSLTDTYFIFNKNEQDDDDNELQQIIDITFADQLQLEEALKASLLTSSQMTGESSSLSFCDLCKGKKANDELKKNGECGHSICFNCSSELKKGNCPVLNCDYALKSDSFKQFEPQDLIFLWENAPKPSSDPIPHFNCRKESHAKMKSKCTTRPIFRTINIATRTRVRIPRWKHNKAIPNSFSNQKEPKQIDKCVKWKGLKEDKRDHEIVWPPMVVIVYARHRTDKNNKWTGMTNQEVMNMFSSYDAIVKAQQCYNVEGHFGKSVLVFESSLMGYLEAERLHKHFIAEGTDRNAWNSQPVYVQSCGEQQLYGYLALKEDVDIFNRTSVKHKLKYEMRLYEEMVVNRIKLMCEDNCELVGLRNRVAEQEKQAKESEQSYDMLKEKMQIVKKEMDVMRNKIKEQHEQHMEEVEFQEQFYKEQIRNIVESRKENDGDLERAQDEENDHEYIREDITNPIKNQDKGRSNARRMLAKIVRDRGVRIGVL